MSYMKRLLEDIIELYDEGYTLSKIAELTELPVDEVDSILSEYHDNYVPIY
jgi:DNA-directed RNA polymerase specialized sigma24 family protein